MKVHAIIHAPFETPGVFKTWAQSKGFLFSETHAYRGESLPPVASHDFYLFMGGPQAPYEASRYPYLKDEIALAKVAMGQNKFVVGVCLGAQIMGEALGAKTEKSASKEVGVFPITLTKTGLVDPLFQGFPESFPVAHWHNDMPGLLQESQALAVSEGCARQIIRYAPRALALQCHMEMTPPMVEGMIENCPQDLTGPGAYIQSAEDFLNQDFESFNGQLVTLLNRLIQVG